MRVFFIDYAEIIKNKGADFLINITNDGWTDTFMAIINILQPLFFELWKMEYL
jgi:apolipoprotein N-acyltransferase